MIEDIIKQALNVRKSLIDDPYVDVYRLFHGHGDGDPRWDAEQFGTLIVLYVYEDLGSDIDVIKRLLIGALSPSALWVKDRWQKKRGDRDNHGWQAYGKTEDAPLQVTEDGLRFAVEPKRSFNSGLFLDARIARQKIRSMAAQHNVLNLFAYTGSLGVAALSGGARSVLHVDSQPALARRIEVNHDLNELPFDERMFLASDVYRFLKKARKGQRRWSLIVLDPPPQVSPKGTPRTGRGQDFQTLIPLCLQVLQPGGQLITFLNRRDISTKTHLQQVETAANKVPLKHCWSLTSGEDFPEKTSEKKLRVISFEKMK